METRHLIAYTLIVGAIVIAAVAGTVYVRRRAARKLRLRGVKSYNRSRS